MYVIVDKNKKEVGGLPNPASMTKVHKAINKNYKEFPELSHFLLYGWTDRLVTFRADCALVKKKFSKNIVIVKSMDEFIKAAKSAKTLIAMHD